MDADEQSRDDVTPPEGDSSPTADTAPEVAADATPEADPPEATGSETTATDGTKAAPAAKPGGANGRPRPRRPRAARPGARPAKKKSEDSTGPVGNQAAETQVTNSDSVQEATGTETVSNTAQARIRIVIRRPGSGE